MAPCDVLDRSWNGHREARATSAQNARNTTMVRSNTVEPPNKGHFGNGPLVLCSEVVPISEVHDFSTHFDCIIL